MNTFNANYFKIKQQYLYMNNISEVDINEYLWNKKSQKKSQNSKNNEWRENCIVDMLKMYIERSYIACVDKPNFTHIYSSLISVFETENFIQKHGKIIDIIAKETKNMVTIPIRLEIFDIE